MRVILVLAIVVGLTNHLRANEIVWHKGSVVLADMEVAVGDIARQSFDVLLLKNSQGGIMVLPAHKVSSFRYYDKEEDVNRTFITAFGRYYERVVYGRISVLRIQRLFSQEISEKDQQDFDFFIEEQKKVYSIKSFRKRFFDRIKDELDVRMVSYEHLDPNTRHGAVSLIVLYNKTATPALAISKAI